MHSTTSGLGNRLLRAFLLLGTLIWILPLGMWASPPGPSDWGGTFLPDAGFRASVGDPENPAGCFIATTNGVYYINQPPGSEPPIPQPIGLQGKEITSITVGPGGVSNAIYVTTSDAVYRSLDHGSTWLPFTGGLPTSSYNPNSLVKSGSYVFVNVWGMDGKMYRTNGSSAWSPLAPLPTGPHGAPFVGTLGKGQDLLGNPILFAGTSGSGLFQSPTFGDSWQPTSLTENQATYVVPFADDPNSPGTLYAANGDAGYPSGPTYQKWMYASYDTGSTWVSSFQPTAMDGPVTSIFPMLLLERDAKSSTGGFSPLYVGTEDGKVLQSLNGGTEWTDLSSGLPSGKSIRGIGQVGNLLLVGTNGGGNFWRPVTFCTLSCEPTASPSSGLAPLTVTFAANGQTPGCSGVPVFNWTFGDGGTSSDKDPTHTYATPGMYTWTFTMTAYGTTCSKSGTVTVAPSTGSIEGAVVAGTAAEAYLLNGPGIISSKARLEDAAGTAVAEDDSKDGGFHFENLQPGMYKVTVELVYVDNIPYDALAGSMGCPHPSGNALQKQVISRPVAIQVAAGPNATEVRFPPPLVFVHGVPGCYQKWFSADPSDPDFASLWDNATRAAGFISFTPNYAWSGNCVSWNQMATQLADQILDDLLGLNTAARGPSLIPAYLAPYDFGGLVARALCSGPNRDHPATSAIRGIFLMATPNSGTDLLFGGGASTLTNSNAIVRLFNELYPDFGSKTNAVFAVGGNTGWWSRTNGDGRVSLYSAFNIARLACNEITAHLSICRPYTYVSFPSGRGHIFPYSHGQLGSPPSTQEVLVGTLLPMIAEGLAPGTPESPAGSILWGTGARTTGAAQGSVQSRASSGQAEFPFTCSATDGMGVIAYVTAGSATFEVVPPSGAVAKRGGAEAASGQDLGFMYTELNPDPGEWTLRVLPGPDGVSFQAVMLESSIFGIDAYTDKASYDLGAQAILRVDQDSSQAPEALFTSVDAFIFGPGGALLQTVPLFDDGDHRDGDAGDGQWGAIVAVPTAPGSYPVAFRARGTYLDKPFVRLAYERLNVVPSTHLFTGVFSDAAVDMTGDEKYDAIRFSAQLDLAPGCGVIVNGDLTDADGDFLSHATAYVEAPARALVDAHLIFRLDRAFCSQFARPLRVANLSALDGMTLAPQDSWGAPIPTALYNASDFDCQAGTVTPSVRASRPDQGTVGQSLDLVVSGRGFKPGATLDFGAGIVVRNLVWLGATAIAASVTLLDDAVPGPRAVSVTNPGGGSDTLQGAFEVVAPSAPSVNMQTPSPGQTVHGTIKASAGASDQVRVTEVALLVDGAPVASAGTFPFQFSWNSRSVPNGSHLLAARATNAAGLTATSPPVAVTVDNPTMPGDCDGSGTVSIGEVQKAINMFLGVSPPDCGVDCNGDGAVSIGEVQKVINGFLGVASSC